ncbi:DNA-binding protein inhibitor ID-2-like, partial [Diretmus argenteus]
MKAVSPVRSGRRSSSGTPTPSHQVPGVSRSKSPLEEPLSLLLQDMNLCYRLLRELVPGLPPGQPVSKVEILQHVIDYILDLQTALDSSPTSGGSQYSQYQHQHQHQHQYEQSQQAASRSPLTALTSDISILTFQ